MFQGTLPSLEAIDEGENNRINKYISRCTMFGQYLCNSGQAIFTMALTIVGHGYVATLLEGDSLTD